MPAQEPRNAERAADFYAVQLNVLFVMEASASTFPGILVLFRDPKTDKGSCMKRYVSSDHLLIITGNLSLDQT